MGRGGVRTPSPVHVPLRSRPKRRPYGGRPSTPLGHVGATLGAARSRRPSRPGFHPARLRAAPFARRPLQSAYGCAGWRALVLVPRGGANALPPRPRSLPRLLPITRTCATCARFLTAALHRCGCTSKCEQRGTSAAHLSRHTAPRACVNAYSRLPTYRNVVGSSCSLPHVRHISRTMEWWAVARPGKPRSWGRSSEPAGIGRAQPPALTCSSMQRPVPALSLSRRSSQSPCLTASCGPGPPAPPRASDGCPLPRPSPAWSGPAGRPRQSLARHRLQQAPQCGCQGPAVRHRARR